MGSEAVWTDICPVCLGSGKMESHNKRLKEIQGPTVCECCNGKGTILVVKKLRKRGK